MYIDNDQINKILNMIKEILNHNLYINDGYLRCYYCNNKIDMDSKDKLIHKDNCSRKFSIEFLNEILDEPVFFNFSDEYYECEYCNSFNDNINEFKHYEKCPVLLAKEIIKKCELEDDIK